MNVAGILSYARLRGNVRSGQYSDSDLLPFLNVRYHQIENAITQLKEDYFYDVLTTDTVANQQRYTMKASSASVEGMKKVINTSIKWGSDDQYYKKLLLSNTDNMDMSLDELASVTSKDEGFYVMKGSEIIIYPTPLTAVTDGLKQEVIVNLTDLATTSEEANIFATSVDGHTELRQYHYIMGLGVAADMFGIKQLFNEQMQLKNEYDIELGRMLSQISDRFASPIIGQLLNTNGLK